jgi:hypothetical protein
MTVSRVIGMVILVSCSAIALADNSNPSVTFMTQTSHAGEIKVVPTESLPSFVQISHSDNNTHLSGHLPFFASSKDLSGISMNFNVFSDETPVCSFTAKIDNALKISVSDIKGNSCHFTGAKSGLDPFSGKAVFHLKLDNDLGQIQAV